MLMCNRKAIAAFAAFMIVGPGVTGAGDTPPGYASATEAYRQGIKAIAGGEVPAALAALDYAAERGVLGAQLKLARLYGAGGAVAKNDAKSFSYYQQIADQHAEITPLSPVAKYVGEAFVALGKYHVQGIPEMGLAANPARAANFFRHAASYFGNADAQYQLARLYLSGEGVPQNVSLAVNWLSIAAKKQHAAAQATLGELLWRGEQVPQRRARGLALIAMAHESAKASGSEPKWIASLYTEVLASSNAATRSSAQSLMQRMGKKGDVILSAPDTTKLQPAKPGAQILMPASSAMPKPAAPGAATTASATPTEPAPAVEADAKAAIGLGFAPGGEPAQLKP
ncbi:MAG: tetratricopeptide repeat protein [Methyloceanibacter sp.]|uniref:tetratricopeptide repeat protein n=1 Tax=Methyloceanibacter sp. TaxID=1965321 RepID=UPI003D9B015A